MLFAKAHPEKVAGVVCVAPVVSSAEQRRREYAYDIAKAARRDDQNALRELSEIGPPPYGTSSPVIRLQRVTERYRGVEFQPHNHAAIVIDAILRGLVTPWEIFRFVQGNQFSLDAMHQESIALDMRSRVVRVDAPVFFFLGRPVHAAASGPGLTKQNSVSWPVTGPSDRQPIRAHLSVKKIWKHFK